MTTNPSKKLSKVFVLIILLVPVNRMQVSKSEVVVVCRSRNEDNVSIPSDPNILRQMERNSSTSIQETRTWRPWSGDIQICFNPSSNFPKFTEWPQKVTLVVARFLEVIYYV